LLWLALLHRTREFGVGVVLAAIVTGLPLWLVANARGHSAFILVSTVIAIGVACLINLVERHHVYSSSIASVAYTDFLTNCANRRAWDEELPQRIDADRRRGWPLAIAVLDLDGFTAYNEDWGHAAGDRLLTDTATSLRFAQRKDPTSPGVSFIARHGADEFSILMEGLEPAEVAATVRRLSQELPGGHTVTAGVACWNRKEGAAELMSRATWALDTANRTRGGERIVVDAGAGRSGGANWLESLPTLVVRQEIEAVYQPIRDLATNALLGYEALARPLGAPADMMVEGMFAAARRLGISRELDNLCQRAAVRGAHELLTPGTSLFINVGVGALADPERDVAAMLRALADARLRPHQIVLEVNESITRLGRFAEATALYRQAGFRFAMDDVGEGMSTIEAIAVVKPEIIKIAKSLVVTAHDVGSAAMIRGLVETARALGGQVIAEGIETQEHCANMVRLGATLGQGWALGRPARLRDVLVAA
jgi:diguanylate cyclase (GGDEF)-like protein